ncbi:GDP-mannose 4,6-dehydratase [Candidatus Marinimicrobia bacterium]|nr:GDP-mannose 4,6-dehydratase [Candidatus Neomarinimicrobiota bacterium]
MSKNIIVTGCSGFIGMHLCKSLLDDGFYVKGIDNMNRYYSVKLKKLRLEKLKEFKNFSFEYADISNKKALKDIFNSFKPKIVINLAAQAGVRYSLKNPYAYVDSNILGFLNILENCRHYNVEGLVYASSSSVYGANTKTPFSISDDVNKPISIYAASKRANELMAYTYNQLFDLKCTGLRFFTVYGPWGRPDMAMYIFADRIKNKKKISVFNNGIMERDFTYIDDIISGIRKAIAKNYSFEIFNLGNNCSEDLMNMISEIETYLGEKAIINFEKMQPGDVRKTFADIDYSNKMLGYSPKISIKKGIPLFLDWFLKYSS